MGLPSPRMVFMIVPHFLPGQTESGALPGLRFDRDAAAVPLDDLLADGQPDAGAGVLGACVQPLKHAEDPFEVLWFDAQAVVSHREGPLRAAILGGRDVDLGIRALVLDGVGDEILEDCLS